MGSRQNLEWLCFRLVELLLNDTKRRTNQTRDSVLGDGKFVIFSSHFIFRRTKTPPVEHHWNHDQGHVPFCLCDFVCSFSFVFLERTKPTHFFYFKRDIEIIFKSKIIFHTYRWRASWRCASADYTICRIHVIETINPTSRDDNLNKTKTKSLSVFVYYRTCMMKSLF